MIFLRLLGFQVTLSLFLTSVAIVIVIKTQCKSKIVILSGYVKHRRRCNRNDLDQKLSSGGSWRAVVALWWEHSPLTNVARVRFPDSAPYVVMWVEFIGVLCSERFFPGYSGFPLSLNHNIVIIWVYQSLFLESPESLREHFEWHNSLCIFKRKASRGTNLWSYFHFYSLYNI